MHENPESNKQITPPVVLIVNAAARRGEQLYTHALDALAQHGIVPADAYPVHDPARLPEVTREAIAAGAKTIIVGGGDGTVSAVVDEFAYHDVTLGLLPLGTGNSFARAVGIPMSLKGAVKVIAHGHVATVDLGMVEDDYFANVADIGMSAEMARATQAHWKRYLGKIAYVLVGGMVLLKHRPFLCRIRVGDEEHVFRANEVIIANGSSFGDSPLTAHGSLQDRKFIVVSVDALSRWRQALVWVAFLFRRPLAFANDHAFTAQELHIETDPPQPIDVDGETTMHTPAHFTVAPQALRILAPAGFGGGVA